MNMPEEHKLAYNNLDLLTRKYADPKDAEMCNYVRFCNDITTIGKTLDSKAVIQTPLLEGYVNKDDRVKKDPRFLREPFHHSNLLKNSVIVKFCES